MGDAINQNKSTFKHHEQVRVPGKIALGFGYATTAARPAHGASSFNHL